MNAFVISLMVVVVAVATAVTEEHHDQCWYVHWGSYWTFTRHGYGNLGISWHREYYRMWRSKACTHGKWSEWERIKVGDCSEECGTGQRVIVTGRSCTKPAPANGGNPCEGSSQHAALEPCNTQPCPVNGEWSAWSDWKSGSGEECSSLCGGGKLKQHRLRQCNNPAPEFGGRNCLDFEHTRENRSKDCNSEECGDRCPLNVVKYLPHPTRPTRFYQCDNGVAKLRRCGPKTEWDQEALTCDVPTSSKGPMAVFRCNQSKGALQPHPTDCEKFIQCVHGTTVIMDCSGGLHWSQDLFVCTYPEDAGCEEL